MASQRCCESECYSHAMQRSLYRHALNALRLASRRACASDEARELAERCAEMLRGEDEHRAESAMLNS